MSDFPNRATGPLRLDCCCSEPPFTPDCRACVDRGRDGVCYFRQRCRDCFWPVFTHPLWLRCKTLYCCCRCKSCRPE